MKPLISMGLIMAGLLVATAQSATAKLPRVILFGREYVSVENWARANGGQVGWSVPKQDVKVTWPGGSLELSLDSRKALLKVTQVWLSAPVAFKNGSAYLGTIDVVTALNPILAPPRDKTTRQLVTAH